MVTTNILGDVVENLVGEAAVVEVVMPPNADPHDFAASAQQAAAMREADALVVNGLGFEEGLVDTIEAAADDGVPVITATDAIDPIPFGDGDDPHLFTDPARMRAAAALIADAARRGDPRPRHGRRRGQGDAPTSTRSTPSTRRSRTSWPPSRRTIACWSPTTTCSATSPTATTSRCVGAVIPGGSTLAEPSAAELADLVREIDEREVPAVFAETSSPTRLAEALAGEGADVAVVELYSESLGEPGSPGGTYLGMVRTNAERIVAALAPQAVG